MRPWQTSARMLHVRWSSYWLQSWTSPSVPAMPSQEGLVRSPGDLARAARCWSGATAACAVGVTRHRGSEPSQMLETCDCRFGFRLSLWASHEQTGRPRSVEESSTLQLNATEILEGYIPQRTIWMQVGLLFKLVPRRSPSAGRILEGCSLYGLCMPL